MSEQITPADSKDNAEPKRSKKPLWWRIVRILIVIVIVLAIVAALLPTIVSTSAGKGAVLGAINGGIRGSVDVQDLSLSWFGTCSLKGVIVKDPQGREEMRVAEIKVDRGLWSLMWSRNDLGQVNIQSPFIHMYMLPGGGFSLGDAFEPRRPAPMKPRKEAGGEGSAETNVTVVITDGQVRLINPDGLAYAIKSVSGKFQHKTLNDIVLSLSGSAGDGKFAIAADVKNAFPGGKFAPEGASGQLSVKTDPPIDIGQLVAFAGGDIQGTGVLNVDASAKFSPKETAGSYKVGIRGLSAGAKGSAVKVTPTDLDLSGDAKLEGKKVVASMNVDGKIGTFKSNMEYDTAGTLPPVDKIVDALMDGRSISLPNFMLSGSGKVDLAAAGKSIPGLLQLRKDVEITSGAIELPELSAKGGDRPSAKASVKVRDLAIVRGGQTQTLEPIEAGLTVVSGDDGTMAIENASLKSAFSQVQAKGNLSKLTADFRADLAAARGQLAELFDLEKVVMSGVVSGTLTAQKKSPQDKANVLSLVLNAQDVRYGQAQESGAASKPAEKDKEGPPAVTGQITVDTTIAQSPDRVAMEGSLKVVKLSTSDMGDIFADDQPVLAYNVTFDTKKNRCEVGKFSLASKLLALELAGSIDRLDSEKILDLKGKYTGSWAEITKLANRHWPDATEALAMLGESQGAITISGPARNPTVQPEYLKVAGGTDVGWAQGSKVYGLTLGQAKLTPELKDAQLSLPKSTIAANGGKINLAFSADFRGQSPTLKIPGKLDVLDNVGLNQELGKYILSRAQPLLGQVMQLEGKVSLWVQDVEVPLGEQIKKSGRGKGRLDFSDVQLTPSGEFGRLVQLMGMGVGKSFLVKMSPVDFELKDGGINYSNFTMTFVDLFAVKFYGSVKFDDTINLVMSVPVNASMLQGLGVKGPVGDIAKVLDGRTIDIPLVGSRTNPKLDLSKVDVKSMVEDAMKKLGPDIIKGEIPKVPGLSGIPGLPGEKAKAAPSPRPGAGATPSAKGLSATSTQPSTTQPPAAATRPATVTATKPSAVSATKPATASKSQPVSATKPAGTKPASAPASGAVAPSVEGKVLDLLKKK